MRNNDNSFSHQAASAPIDSLDSFHQYQTRLQELIDWDSVGVLTDEGNKNTIILLCLIEEVVATFRLCLTPDETIKCLEKILPEGKEHISFRNIQGYQIKSEDLLIFSSISAIWVRAENQSHDYLLFELEALFRDFEEGRKEIGRGADFKAKTINTVWRESYCRCMFRGCGEKLDHDAISGTTGNYAYLAHNVASSEQGARGITDLSNKLSNDPSNILLLCDKHHRLIDKVAANDYPASMLSAMKKEFNIVANSLLDGLNNKPIPVYAVLWPVNSQTVSPPSSIQIANCLSLIKFRMHGQINTLSDNENLLIDSPEIIWAMMPILIQVSVDKIIQQINNFDFNAALFAFGPTSALIGLGALLGNKNNVIPMLRFRDSGTWCWPRDVALGDLYDIEGFDSLNKNTDVVINIALTAEPESLIEASKVISDKKSAQIISIRAKKEHMGNGAISHPEDGRVLTSKLQSIFHTLKSEYGVQTVHLFTCASNAAAVFIGQAYDLHHPDVIIYDFDEGTMEPRLKLKNENHKCQLSIFT